MDEGTVDMSFLDDESDMDWWDLIRGLGSDDARVDGPDEDELPGYEPARADVGIQAGRYGTGGRQRRKDRQRRQRAQERAQQGRAAT
jgi:hypothetical protein